MSSPFSHSVHLENSRLSSLWGRDVDRSNETPSESVSAPWAAAGQRGVGTLVVSVTGGLVESAALGSNTSGSRICESRHHDTDFRSTAISMVSLRYPEFSGYDSISGDKCPQVSPILRPVDWQLITGNTCGCQLLS
ncbi:MAG: hypothetical protein J07HQX50_01156 [Haloquadratum sp. J07HQX50]|nr:MAG: hypothetical protein J07HQX50_01156 [Haloquadratum sp. J07HQX50]